MQQVVGSNEGNDNSRTSLVGKSTTSNTKNSIRRLDSNLGVAVIGKNTVPTGTLILPADEYKRHCDANNVDGRTIQAMKLTSGDLYYPCGHFPTPESAATAIYFGCSEI